MAILVSVSCNLSLAGAQIEHLAALIGRYFWDTDFLLDGSTLIGLGPADRKTMSVADEVFGIAQGLPPHPDELKLTPWDGPD